MLNKQKRQFKRTAQLRPFFDRRVRPTGNTISISLGKFIPATWIYVRLELIDRTNDSVTIKFNKLLEKAKYARSHKVDKRSGQNTQRTRRNGGNESNSS